MGKSDRSKSGHQREVVVMRIAILDKNDAVLAFMDNSLPGAMHFYDDVLHNYLEGTASSFEFSTVPHEDSEYLIEGNHLSFRHGKRDYYFNIIAVERSEFVVTVTAYALVFDLLNEQIGPYSAQSAMSFAEYLNVFGLADVLTIGLNEVSTKRITHEWTGTDTALKRLYSLAEIFGAELEFVSKLNENFTLRGIVLDIYSKHTSTNQGIGSNHTDCILRYGKDISGITKKSDITDLVTAIKPTGKDGLTISTIAKKEYDSDGKVEYETKSNEPIIRAVQAVQNFPSNTLASVTDRYIVKPWEYDTDNVNVLYGQALAELKKLCVPQVEYTIDGYVEAEIGDSFVVQDEGFEPALYLSVRVSEQEISFSAPSTSKTTYSNVREIQAGISDELLERVNALIESNKTYMLDIFSHRDNGQLILTAKLLDGMKDVTKKYPESNFAWYEVKTTELEKVGNGYSYTAADEKTIYRCIYSDEEG